jgi:hypothetical protein
MSYRGSNSYSRTLMGKKKCKYWRWKIPRISTKGTIISDLNSLNNKRTIKKNNIQLWKYWSCLGTGTKNVVRLNRLMNHRPPLLRVRVRVIVFNPFSNNISVISWRPVFEVEESRVPRENHWSAASHWQIWSHSAVWSTHCNDQDLNSQL